MSIASDKKRIREIINDFIAFNNINPHYLQFDKKLSNLEEKFIRWISCIEEQDEDVFLELFRKLKYYNRIEVINTLETLYKDFKLRETTFPNSVFLPVSSFGGIANGAISLLDCFREAVQDEAEVSKKRIAPQPRDFFHEFDITTVQNLVLIDDVIGSGDTLINFLIRLELNCPELIEGRKIYIFSLINLQKGIDNVLAFAKDNGLDLKFVNESVIEKAFSNQATFPTEKSSIEGKRIVRKYEKRISSNSIYVMGYKRSEALVSFFFNTPNNTLTTFWENDENKNWFSVFPRDKSEDTFELKENNSLAEIKRFKKLRELTNYSIIKLIRMEKQRRTNDGI
ncbi:phosphoribosyltransferase [Peribacillus frigoritolerans]|uniref:phosphoribosyltransferase n=1 Tax=Peribacillus TaxID=2675229 RepID=UPI00296F1747|nr:phosphoribosyltransferase [Peribacillus castrilensis]